MPSVKSFHVYAGGGDFDGRPGAAGGRGGPEHLPEHRRVRTVFIHNMPTEMTERDVIKLAMVHGEVERVNYAWHTVGEKRGQPRGFATIEYKYVLSFVFF